jgi:hypothetical protein
VRRRILAPAVERANERLTASGAEPLPERLTPQSLRRTFASVLYALGETPPYVMAQMGHTTPDLALAIYACEMDAETASPSACAPSFAATIGYQRVPAPLGDPHALHAGRLSPREKPRTSGAFLRARPTGFEPVTSCSGGKRSIH